MTGACVYCNNDMYLHENIMPEKLQCSFYEKGNKFN